MSAGSIRMARSSSISRLSRMQYSVPDIPNSVRTARSFAPGYFHGLFSIAMIARSTSVNDSTPLV